MSGKDMISLVVVVAATGMAVTVPLIANDSAMPAPAQVGSATETDTVRTSAVPSSTRAVAEAPPPVASDGPSASERRALALRAKASLARRADAAGEPGAETPRARRARTTRPGARRTAPPLPISIRPRAKPKPKPQPQQQQQPPQQQPHVPSRPTVAPPPPPSKVFDDSG